MRKIIKIVNLILIIIILYFAKAIVINKFFNQTLVVVPNVLNLQKEEAAQILEESDLNFNYISSRSNEVPYNYIHNQSPKANEKVKKNRAIKLYVNDEEGAKLPNLKNLTLVEAMKILKEKNVEVRRIDYVSTNVEEDTVIASYPKEGSLIKYGEKLSLLVSTQKISKENVMPNIIGLDFFETEKMLSDLGLEVEEVIGIQDNNYPENMIIKTEPMPDVQIDEKTKLRIYVSVNVKNNGKIKEKIQLDQKYIDDIIKNALKEKNEEN